MEDRGPCFKEAFEWRMDFSVEGVARRDRREGDRLQLGNFLPLRI
jgi:hypothetical protein